MVARHANVPPEMKDKRSCTQDVQTRKLGQHQSKKSLQSTKFIYDSKVSFEGKPQRDYYEEMRDGYEDMRDGYEEMRCSTRYMNMLEIKKQLKGIPMLGNNKEEF